MHFNLFHGRRGSDAIINLLMYVFRSSDGMFSIGLSSFFFLPEMTVKA